jgi:hypothetical protein
LLGYGWNQLHFHAVRNGAGSIHSHCSNTVI